MTRQQNTTVRSSTIVLRSAIALLGLIVLAICTLILPQAIHAELEGDFDYGPIMLGLYVAAIPFFIALHQSLQLLGYIDKNNIFSSSAVHALKRIKYCAFTISNLFAVGMPYIFYVADQDDAPGVVALGLLIIGASFAIGSLAALFQSLLKHVVDMKTEHDLTV